MDDRISVGKDQEAKYEHSLRLELQKADNRKRRRMGVLRWTYTPLPVGGFHPSPTTSSSISPPPWPNLKHNYRGWRPTSRPRNNPRCTLDTSGDQSAGLTKDNSQSGAVTSTLPSFPMIEDYAQVTRLASNVDPNTITEWELDFCSRPILDMRGKKLWELVVCDSKRVLQFARFYPNNVINSITLKDALMSIVQTLGVPKPRKIRFFRSQMQTIISKACSELDIKPVPSRRCVSLIRWLEERYQSVYMQHPGFQEGAKPLLTVEKPFPLDLPDNLYGEKWAFVQLPLAESVPVVQFSEIMLSVPCITAVQEEIDIVMQGSSFGSVLDLDVLGINLPDDALIPGLAVASSRAIPLAAWTNALELSSVEVDPQQGCLVLSAGVSNRWLYAFYKKNRQTAQEADSWEAAKKACSGLHFLAIQDSLDSDACTGFWLMLDMPNPPV